ncbi:hypothetical protein A8B75_19330 [Sphingomonadales bacterium EhC05]|nr:hypothetical protein A8B75_19330 [Sphingomonadales bacterium EhC05]
MMLRVFLATLLILLPTVSWSQESNQNYQIASDLNNLKEAQSRLGSDSPEILELIDRLTGLYYDRGQFDAAEPLYLQALDIRKKIFGGEHPDTLQTLNDLGIAYHEQGRFSEAEPLLENALRAREKVLGDEHPDTVSSVNDLATLYQSQGRYGEAQPLFQRALDIRSKTGGAEHADTLVSLNNLAVLYYYQGQYGKAEPLFLRALDANQRLLGSQHRETLTSLNNLALIYRKQERFDEAEPLYLKALEGRENSLGREHPDTLHSINTLADLYMDLGNYGEAETLHKRAISARQNMLGPEHPNTLLSINRLANLYYAQDRLLEAEPLFVRAMLGRYRVLGEDHIDLADSMAGFGKLLARRDNGRIRAVFFLKKAVNNLQGVRQNMANLSSGTQSAFVQRWREAYLSLQQLLVVQGRFAEAEQVGRMIKETEYFAFVRGDTGSKIGEPLPMNIQEKQWNLKLESWLNRPNQLLNEIANLQKKRNSGAKLSDLDIQKLDDLEAAYNRSYAMFRTTINGWLKNVQSTKNEQVQEEARALELASSERLQGVIAGIGKDVGLLQLVAFEDSLHMFLITPGAFKHVGVPVRREDLFNAVFDARQEIEKGRNPNTAAQTEHKANLRSRLGVLYEWLIKPIETDLADASIKTLMLNVQGEIRYVPFAALWDGRGWLAERYQLALYTPAAQTRFISPKSMKRASAFGLSDAAQGFSALPAVRDELYLIVGDESRDGVLEGNAALNERFTRASLEESLTTPAPILHIASHFVTRPGDESASFLLLGDGSQLSIADINRSSKLRFRGVELLTLSACETAIGGKGIGMEIEGIGALAQNKGAASVIASLWPVSDDTTPVFMRDLYDGIANHQLSKAAALQAAQLNMIRSPLDNDPFYWAPFVIMGNWR